MKNSHQVEFYFDCSSPWTYLAFSEILPLSQRQGIQIIWKPILVGGVFNNVNQDVYEFRSKPNPLKLSYSNNDMSLWSKLRGIKITIPKVFPVNSVKAMRGCFFAMQQDKLEIFAHNVFKSYWSDGVDISQEDNLLEITKNSGLDPVEFKNFISSQEAKELLLKNTDELIDRGGFGSPTFFYKQHMFFGNDRLHILEEAIAKNLI